MNRKISLSSAFRQTGTVTEGFIRSILRQPVFAVLFLIPSLTGLLIRPLPGLMEHYLPDFDFYPQVPLFLALIAGFPAYLFGFLSSLMLLDERDRGLLPALRVTPLSDHRLMVSRILPSMILAMTGTAVALLLSGQSFRISPAAVLAASMIAVPSAAFYALTGAALAGNKVQGISIGKVLGLMLPAPLLLALLPSPWRFAALIFPPAWMGAVIGNPVHQWLWAGGGIVYTSILVMLTQQPAMKRYFSK